MGGTGFCSGGIDCSLKRWRRDSCKDFFILNFGEKIVIRIGLESNDPAFLTLTECLVKNRRSVGLHPKTGLCVF